MAYFMCNMSIQKQLFDVIVTRRRNARSFIIRLKMQRSEIHISAPAHARQTEIRRFFNESVPNITNHIRQRLLEPVIPIHVNMVITLIDKQYWLCSHDMMARNPGDHPCLTAPCFDHHPETIKQLFQCVIRRYTQNKVREILHTFKAFSCVNTPPIITFKDPCSRWGSCCPRLNRIMLSWRLVFAPRSVLDSVIVHEVSHLIHHNHSKEFWNLVTTCDQRYESSALWLREYGKDLFQYQFTDAA